MRTIADLMTTNLVTVTENHTMKNVHDLINKKGIRHIPVMDNTGEKMLGLVTQKIMISRVVKYLTEFGSDFLLEKEMQTSVLDIASTDFDKVSNTMSLKDAATYFLENKHGCLPVFDENEALVGILTSSDFVKLSLSLLNK